MFFPPLVSRASSALGAAAIAATVLIACATSPKAKEEKLCTPGQYVFCRCQDRSEGTKLCKEDGQSFGPCEPCESFDNPEIPFDPDDPFEPHDPIDGERPQRDSGAPSKAECGDAVVQDGEDCDDGNSDETDGCNSSCKLAGIAPARSNACPGIDVHVWGGEHRPSIVVQTTGSGNRSVSPNCTGGPNPTSGAAAPDRIFSVVAHATGTMTVRTEDVDYNSFLYVSDECAADSIKWLACVNDNGSVGGETLTFPVEAGKRYYVFVDGAGLPPDNAGSGRVTFSIQ